MIKISKREIKEVRVERSNKHGIKRKRSKYDYQYKYS